MKWNYLLIKNSIMTPLKVVLKTWPNAVQIKTKNKRLTVYDDEEGARIEIRRLLTAKEKQMEDKSTIKTAFTFASDKEVTTVTRMTHESIIYLHAALEEYIKRNIKK